MTIIAATAYPKTCLGHGRALYVVHISLSLSFIFCPLAVDIGGQWPYKGIVNRAMVPARNGGIRMFNYEFDNGGKPTKGRSGDCGLRAAAIVTDRPYNEVKADIEEINAELTGGLEKSCNNGTPASAIHKYMTGRGFRVVVTKGHYIDSLPKRGRVLAFLPGHFVAVIDGTFRDTWDSRKSWRTKSGIPRLIGYYTNEPR